MYQPRRHLSQMHEFSQESVHQKLLKSLHFSQSSSKYNGGGIFETQCVCLLYGNGGLLKKIMSQQGRPSPPAPPFECATGPSLGLFAIVGRDFLERSFLMAAG